MAGIVAMAALQNLRMFILLDLKKCADLGFDIERSLFLERLEPISKIENAS